MRSLTCDVCGRERTTDGHCPDGWISIDNWVQCIECRLKGGEFMIRQLTNSGVELEKRVEELERKK